MRDLSPYPATPAARDAWIVGHRPPRQAIDPLRPYAFLVEPERDADGSLADVATIFLTNRECPWRCLMCDLWRNTLTETVPVGAIPAQIDYALAQLPPARHIKLYNSGSFFDARAIPPADYPAIAQRLGGFERVIVECHPSLVGLSSVQFQQMLREHNSTSKLEVAMGLETAHPEIGPRLNKRMSLKLFRDKAEWLREHDIALRVFILVKPPFMTDEAEALHWANRSLDFALECGAEVVALIPTRPGNGALDALMARGEFAPPRLATLEAALAYGLTQTAARRPKRVFADLWDLGRFSHCADCFSTRAARLEQINYEQAVPPALRCESCGDTF